MLACYRTQIITQLAGRVFTTTFYWMTEIDPSANPWLYASGINETLISTTPFFNRFQLLISREARIRRVKTSQKKPEGSASATFNFPGTGIIGGWDADTVGGSVAAFIQTIGENDYTGKHGVRVSPLGFGADETDRWSGLFSTAAFNFEVMIAAIYNHPTGPDFQGCIIDKLGIFSPIVGAQLLWPASRQIQRRKRV